MSQNQTQKALESFEDWAQKNSMVLAQGRSMGLQWGVSPAVLEALKKNPQNETFVGNLRVLKEQEKK